MPAPTDASPKGKKHFALKFISGKYQGEEFPIASEREIFIGRATDLDVVLVEDMVSRKHAKISFAGDVLTIEDLGSTNGTFVNGEKVRRARLKEGDRVLIGTSIVRIALTEAAAGGDAAREAEARASLQSAGARPTSGKSMSGALEEVPLVDLLQLFATSKKSGVLLITQDGTVGRVYLRKGQVCYASINENAELRPLKAMYRLLTWERGQFELLPPDEREFGEEIEASTEGVLMEGMRQLDETRRILSLLPRGGRYTLAQPLVPPLKDLAERELTVLQLMWNVGRVDALLDRTRLTDLEAFESVLKLVQKGYLKPVEG